MKLKIIGGGLAGCEAAWQAANRGIKVKLYEMKPSVFSPAHTNENLCELVCSNSLKGNGLDNACGLLKEEMRRMGSLVIDCADRTSVPAGGALAVDRDKFSALVTKHIKEHPNIELIRETVNDINTDEYTIVATGPLTHSTLTEPILKLTGEKSLFFFDAAAPVVTRESIDESITYLAARYGKGTPDYINCPMEKGEYEAFYNALISAERAPLHEDVEDVKVFEGCMPVEIMAQRGKETLCFGPLKPKGLPNPKTGREPYAVLQLRRDNTEGTLYNLVGFQTNLKFGEQKRVFSMIPGLKNAEFVRYGVMHRNTYINSPLVLENDYSLLKYPKVFFAGQITGVEGYVESASSGLVAGINAARKILGRESVVFPPSTCTGALIKYITDRENRKFQPMNANFGIIEWERIKIKNKKERYEYISSLALEALQNIQNGL
ncbi:MAG: methylenetetrahydrofolate--tRNA-(uracil(54)-C(5))-methyltransferase (FADH(2)-oxidizing) TrmFO [Clostridia bacterium]|nr:methylenetetrahydrofolate--tRNA-(uracil(54)-C(5))-methyltransferase (FADH(2)-oxidizing) TrmFO [Clostridia bacterium]MBQ6937081.1 methylenetetrahydrofolate--tRNA-(uracil(54)-C(5))-methyltransferase (FADH(2)-oxidizing) TrmFO [Clostridia bacterium]